MATGAAINRWRRPIRWVCVLVALCASEPAIACIVNEDAATEAARAVAVTRFCPGFQPITDAGVPSLFEELGAVEASEDQEELRPTCIAIVLDRAATEDARLRKAPQVERDATCTRAANDAELKQALESFGLVKPPR
jgi:hypothetical protein